MNRCRKCKAATAEFFERYPSCGDCLSKRVIATVRKSIVDAVGREGENRILLAVDDSPESELICLVLRDHIPARQVVKVGGVAVLRQRAHACDLHENIWPVGNEVREVLRKLNLPEELALRTAKPFLRHLARQAGCNVIVSSDNASDRCGTFLDSLLNGEMECFMDDSAPEVYPCASLRFSEVQSFLRFNKSQFGELMERSLINLTGKQTTEGRRDSTEGHRFVNEVLLSVSDSCIEKVRSTVDRLECLLPRQPVAESKSSCVVCEGSLAGGIPDAELKVCRRFDATKICFACESVVYNRSHNSVATLQTALTRVGPELHAAVLRLAHPAGAA